MTNVVIYKLKDDFNIDEFRLLYNPIGSGKRGNWVYEIYTKKSNPISPTWLSLVKNLVDATQVGKNIYNSLVIIFSMNTHRFALCAGYGYVDIHNYAVQDYGIDIALRSIDPYKLKSIIQKVPIGNVFTYNRTLRGQYIPEFDQINKKSVLRNIAGKCADKIIGKSISGTTSLTVSGKGEFSDILELLDALVITENKTPVLKIDGLKSAPKEIYNQLNDILMDKINGSEFEDVFICYDDEKIQMSCEKIEVSGELFDFDDAGAILEKTKSFGPGNFKRLYAQGFDCNGQKLPIKKLIDLLEGEVKLNDEIYFRINKKWYKVPQETVKKIEEDFSKFQPEAIPYLSDWRVQNNNPENEDTFLDRVTKSNPQLILAHKKKLLSGGIEFADIYDKEQERIIHVKNGRGAFLRGLFAQGFVSGKLLAGNANFRKEIQAKMGIVINDHSKQRIIYAIFNPKPDISPFTLFAKVDFMERIASLKENNYNVGYVIISPKLG